jgi:L-2,4-diaminobutyrate decarboxylase
LKLGENAAWLHVDAAWAGPLRFSNIHSNKLNGIERADSVAISAHKWLFQPKESGLILFKDVDVAHKSVSFGGAYLAVPNVGVLGSRGANAIPLLATLLAWGREGLADRIGRAMTSAQKLHDYLATREDVSLFSSNASGVVLWRPTGKADVKSIINELPVGAASFTSVNEVDWIRHVAANPNANIEQLIEEISTVLNDRALRKSSLSE